MPAHKLVIVESPAKAKTINKYLGKDYDVIASFGHIRDLPPKDGSVDPSNSFAMKWELGDRSAKNVGDIVRKAKEVDTVYLATDPDREGEAISWHVNEVLREKKIPSTVTIKRVTFNEITKSAVLDAFKQARDIDKSLVDAYLARRALDYLVGFTLSPILWRKLPGSRSAGRVQSVALRLICEREHEIEAFNTEEYWSIDVGLTTPENKTFTSRLHSLDGKKLDKFSLRSKADADTALARIKGQDFSVANIERRQVKRAPYAPFITSTLQQEASRKLRLSATRTMRIAQKLYEGVDIGGETVGLITYMRTDGVTLSGEAISAVRKLIGNKFGEKYLPQSPRVYKSRVKNAQEAHEAIRPTDIFRSPDEMKSYLDDDEFRLYELIWKRTVACQMEQAVMDQVSVDIQNKGKDVGLRASGSIITFDGFLKVYREDRDDEPAANAGEDNESGDEERRLPPLHEKDPLKIDSTKGNQHFTQPPPRYTEASLVKRLEELGIGRPSTYASIMQVLQDRDYVKLDQRRFIPESRGRIVTAFLENFFSRYVEYNFTADLEKELDDISSGELHYKDVLTRFWSAFADAVEKTKDLSISDVIDALDEDLSPYLFPSTDPDARKCKSCGTGHLSLKLGRFGAFVGCSNYPECKYTRPVLSADAGEGDGGAFETRTLGTDPASGMPVTVRKGPYGAYVQIDAPETAPEAEDTEETVTGKGAKKKKKAVKPKPRRAGLLKHQDPTTIDYETAMKLLSLPREVGNHPETGEMIKAGIGRFGPFIVHQGKFKSIPSDDPDGVFTIGLNRAVDLLAQESRGRGGMGGTVMRDIGMHPSDQKAVQLVNGRYGPYIRYGSNNAPIPKGQDMDAITLEQAVTWLAEKAAKGKGKTGRTARKPAARKSTTTKKAAPKKTSAAKTTKKPAAKKTASTKAKVKE